MGLVFTEILVPIPLTKEVCHLGTAGWKRCLRQGMWERAQSVWGHHLQLQWICSQPGSFWNLCHLGLLWRLYYIGITDGVPGLGTELNLLLLLSLVVPGGLGVRGWGRLKVPTL